MKYKDIIGQLRKSVDTVLDNEVLNAVRVVEAKAIANVVYSVYEEPKVYGRRDIEGGGLPAPENIVGKASDGYIFITNITRPHPVYAGSIPLSGRIDEAIEYGGMYDYPVPRQVYGSRPFTRATTYSLHQGKQHVKALKKGLKDMGYDVL